MPPKATLAAFSASPLPPSASESSLPLPAELLTLLHLPQSAQWYPALSAPYPHSLDVFQTVLNRTVVTPEYSSSTILRADLERDDLSPAGFVQLDGFTLTRRIRRKLVAKLTRDGNMSEECVWYNALPGPDEDDSSAEPEAALLLLPDFDLLKIELEGVIPYYHPQVAALAFRFLPPTSPDEPAQLRIDLLALPSQPFPLPLPPTDRTYRTALMLAKQIVVNSRGEEQNYIKRVNHDLLAGKEEVQDVYRAFKQRYSHVFIPLHEPRITFPRFLLGEWAEQTDPQKHLWEDCAIASWLMVVWKAMYGLSDVPGRVGNGPPGGFVDVGCGNGLLVYILACEGYTGYGVDLRARKSWDVYKPRPDLRTASLNPPEICLSEDSVFPPGSFLIGNHADELSPWIPLLAASTPGAAFLNIPCCPHKLSGRFTSPTYSLPPEFLDSLPDNALPPPPLPPSQRRLLAPFYAPTPDASLHGGRSFAYQLYLVELMLRAGYVPERECLRMPSTKNVGLLGRRRVWEGVEGGGEEEEVERVGSEGVRREVRRLVEGLVGEWVARVPEGKAAAH